MTPDRFSALKRRAIIESPFGTGVFQHRTHRSNFEMRPIEQPQIVLYCSSRVAGFKCVSTTGETMRYALRSWFTLCAGLLLAGCMTEPNPSPPKLYTGMSRDDLRLFFGKPLRINPNPAGGEDWIYTFRSRTPNPNVQTTDSGDAFNRERSTTATYSFPSDKHEAAIHLSPDGHVIEPLPEGDIIR
jgi:outer membrane protein assembly factor BamE (lipoprotein component of BamABCDE complex)